MIDFLVLGIAVFFIVTLVRAFGWPAEWAAKKPLNCVTCLSGWAAIGLCAVVVYGGKPLTLGLVLQWAAAAGVSVLLDAGRTALLRSGAAGEPWPGGPPSA